MIQSAIRAFGVISGVFAFLCCLYAGIGLQGSDESPWAYIGIYFIGKGVFVGASLIVMSLRDLTPK